MPSRRVRDVLLRITGDASSAQDELHELAREVGDFGRIKAEATVDVNTRPAEQAMAGLKQQVRDFSKLTESAKIDLQTAGAQAQLDRLRQRLEALSKREASPKIDIAVAKTVAQIEVVEARLAKLDRRKVDIDVDVGRGLGGAASTLGTVATSAGRGFGVLFTALSSGIPVLGGVGRAFTSAATAGASLGPIFLALIPVVLLLAGTIVVSLVGALGALAASLVAATAGLAALATAFAVALGPVAIVAVAVFARLAEILKAVKENEDQAAQAGRRVRDAHQAQRAAANQLATANENLTRTATEGYKAWADAIEAVDDAQRNLQHSELGVERANLTLRQAKRNLADFRKEAGLAAPEFDDLFKKFTDVDFRPVDLVKAIRKSAVGRQAGGADPLELADKILDVKDAQLGVADALDTRSDAQTTLNEANARAQEFAEKGIAAYQPYVQALAGVETATLAVRDATEKSNDAAADRSKKLKALSPQEQRFARVIGRLKESFKNLLAPATNAAFRGIIRFLEDLERFGRNRRVRDALTNIGRAIGSVFRGFGRELNRKETRNAFVEIATAAARLLRALGGRGMRDFFRLVTRIAREAMPYLVEKIEDAVDWFDRLVRKHGTRKGVSKVIADLVDHFDTWWGLAKEIAGVLGRFFDSAKDDGRSLARHIGDIVHDFGTWLDKNPDALKDFFHDAAENTKSIADSLESIAGSIDDITKSVRDGKDVWDKLQIVNPLLLPGRVGKLVHRQHGGLVGGTGSGDIVPAMLEPGEFVIRRSVAAAIGISRLNRLNAGGPALATAGRGGVHVENINLPPAPGHGQLGDPRHQAVQLARELRRRGSFGIPGGGIG